MQSELYFDSSYAETGGGLYRLTNSDGSFSFLYDHSTYDAYRDEIKVYKTPYPSFEAFWQMLTGNKEWFYLHPLYVHPTIRGFISEQLKGVNWQIQGDAKWQESHKRQWKKVLTDPENYYKPGKNIELTQHKMNLYLDLFIPPVLHFCFATPY